MRVKLAVPAMCLALISLAFSSCGMSTRTGPGSPAGTRSPSPGYSQTQAAATPRPTSTQVALRAPCDPSIAGMRSGDLLVYSSTYQSQRQYPIGFGGLAYPRVHVPDGTPLKPLQIQAGQSQSGVVLSADTPTNPDMHEHIGGYAFTVCNLSSTQSHVVQSVSVAIASASSYSGALNEWNWCDGPFDAHSRQSSGGCGGAYFAGEYLHASFASNAGAGATVPAVQVKSGNDDPPGDGYPFGALPVTLRPGDALPINVGMTAPTTPATYTLAFQVEVDGTAITASAPPTLFAPAAHEWGGEECMSSSMQSQIPAASMPTYYICPAS